LVVSVGRAPEQGSFRLLGPVRLVVGGREIDLGPSKERALLAALLLAPGRPVPVEALVDRVWAGQPPRQPRRVLATYVSRLRRAVDAADPGLASLRYAAGGYLIDCDPDRVDLHRARRLAAEAREAARLSNPRRAADLFTAALAGWEVDALAGVAGEWPARVRDGVLAERLDLVAERADADLGLGRHAAVVDELRGLVTQHPTAEELVARLIRALAGAGRSVEALACYERLRLAVAEALGAEPSAPLQQLHLRVLRNDPSLRPASRPAPAPTSVPADAAGLAEYAGPAGEPEPEPEPGERVMPSEEAELAEGAGPAGVAAVGAPGADSAAAPVRPAQLPADVAGFTGRAGYLERLDAQLPAVGAADPPAVAVALTVITGTAGVGKTALAVHWGHRVADRFAGGQLYVNLHGHAAGPPLRPIEALAGFLRAVGVPPDQVPADVEQAAALYRSTLAGRRMLLVLDDAAGPEQVRPLLPGAAGCLVLVTSRERLSGLAARDGASRLELDVLDPDEAGTLLRRTLGPGRVNAEPAAAAELAAACAHLPLALRIAAARLADAPGRPIAAAVAELTGDDRLAALQADSDPQAAVRVAFERSYSALAAPARRMLRLVGLLPGPDLTPDAATALAAVAPAEIARQLDRLAGAHLLTQPAPGRYGCHDLLRSYATERAHEVDSAADRTAAVRRLLDWYLRRVDAAAGLLYPEMVRLPGPAALAPASSGQPTAGRPADPAGSSAAAAPTADGLDGCPPDAGFADHTAALAWLDAERPNLVAAVRHATTHGPAPAAWLLADALRGYLWMSRHTVDWLEVAGAGLAAATSVGDRQAQAALRLNLGMANYCLGRHPAALEQLTASAELAEQAGWLTGWGASLANLGIVHGDMGEPQRALEHITQSLTLYEQAGYALGRGAAISNLSVVHLELGHLAEAVGWATRALDHSHRVCSPDGQATGLLNLAEATRALGRPRAALDHVTAALQLFRETGNRYGETGALAELAALHLEAGRLAEALQLGGQARVLAYETGYRRNEADALNLLGRVTVALGQPAEAARNHYAALAVARAIQAPYREADALVGLAAVDRCRGDHTRATERAGRALAAARRSGYRLLEGRSLTTLASIDLGAGRHQAAAEHAEQALAVYLATGHPLGQADAHAALSRALRQLRQAGAADRHTAQARARYAEVGAPVPADLPDAGRA
jgi:DNA-binding SARP family transcriptional activator